MKDKTKRSWNFKDLTNKIFGYLTVIKFNKREKDTTFWICKCKCGNISVVASTRLVSGMTKSCGCLRVENQLKLHYRHGMTGTRFHHIWQSMKKRCNTSTDSAYFFYGGRGITVCERWLESFENFRDDMYQSYLDHVKKYGEDNTSIDRIDPNGNYSLDNCRWATQKDQNNNRRTTPKTENLSLHKAWKKRLVNIIHGARFTFITSGKSNSPLFLFYIGVSFSEFKQYIESLWLPGMTWDNYGRGLGTWQFDHIIGCNNFDLSKEEDRLKCFNYKNFQPLWDADHKKKSKRVLIYA